MAPRAHWTAGLTVALALAAAAAGLGQGNTAAVEDPENAAIKAGRAALVQGAYEQARADFERELETARRRGDHAGESDLLFYIGLTEQQRAGRLAPEDPERRRRLEESVNFYARALEIKSRLKQPLGPTLNNLGRAYADLGWNDTARDTLKRALVEAKDDPRWPLYAKSYARLLAESGSWREAATWYRTVFEAWPEDAEAHQALVDLYRERAPEELPGHLWWLVERGQVDRAQAGALTVLAGGGLTENVDASLLGVVAGTLAKQYGAPSRFREGAAWKALASLEADEQIGPGVRELARLYTAEDFQPESYRWWQEHGLLLPGEKLAPRQAFQRLAVAIGQWHERGATPAGLALAERYFLLANGLWKPEPDPIAIFELADLYIQTGRLEDLKRLSEVSQSLLETRGRAYQRRDWHAVFDFHRALGLVYGTLGWWGDSSTPASAVFQLERARMAAEEYNRIRPAGAEPLAVSPQLVGLLAQGYEETGRADDARTIRAEAAAEYRRMGDDKAAQLVLTTRGIAPAAAQGEKSLYKLGLMLARERNSRLDGDVLNAATEAFVSARRFAITDRKRLDAVLIEKDLQEVTGQRNQALSDVLGLDLLGLVEYTVGTERMNESILTTFTIEVRLVDVKTGRILGIVTSERPDLIPPPSTLREASRHLLQSVREAFPPYGYVVKVADKDVIVDLGSEVGLQKGDVLEILREQEQITPPVTGEGLSAEMVVVGELEVVFTSPRLSTCRLKSGGGQVALALGNPVRLKEKNSLLTFRGATMKLLEDNDEPPPDVPPPPH
jgi:tetratricopeptide (TPR) repeat protein